MNNHFRLITCVAAVALCLPTTTYLFGQKQNVDFATTTFVKHFESKQAIPATMVIGSTAGIPPFNWFFCEGGGCTPSAVGSGTLPVGGASTGVTITFTNSNATVTVNNAVEGEYPFTIRRTGGGVAGFAQRNYRLIVRPALRMIFVLDRSGSMECAPSAPAASWPGCIIATGHRWDALKTGVKNFVDKFQTNNENALANDRMSVVYFSGATVAPAGTFGALINVTDFNTGVTSNMGSAPAQNGSDPVLGRDGTSIGAGVLEAINSRLGGVENNSFREVIVVFTDGEQNAAPNVVTTATTREIQAADASTLKNLNATNLDGIEIYTVGVGTIPAFTTLLQELAGGASGYFTTTAGNEAGFMGELSGNAFNEIFNKFSPQHIKFEQQAITGANTLAVNCNKNVSRLFFEAHFDRPFAGSHTRFEIYRNGVKFPLEKAQALVTPFLITYTIDFQELPEYTSEGAWEFKMLIEQGSYDPEDIYHPGPPSVKLFATADDHEIDMETKVGNTPVVAGSKAPISLTLSHQGNPIKNAVVKARIIKPSVDVSDLLARAQVTGPLPDNPELGSCAGRTLAWLQANNPGALDSLKIYFGDTLTLPHKGDGKYEAVYGDWAVTGVHKVIFSVVAEDAAYGKLERMKDQTVNVRIAPVLYKQKERTYNKDGRVSYLGLRPQYESEGRTYYVGPGYGYAFSVKGAGVERVTINDECGGKYGLSVQAEGDPKVKVYLLDEEIYRGKLSRFDKPYIKHKWGISAHAGITRPLGKLDSLYVNGGFYAEIDAGYQFTPNFSLEGRGGYYGFDQNFYVLGATLYAKGQFPLSSSGLSMSLAAGAGIYKPKNTDSSGGYSLRLALHWAATSRLDLSLEGGYFNLPTPDYQFLTAGLGLRYRL
ncbi:MAG: VWA domain-containing protein [Saprospiraceae bacterium]|nr:VWA domain-containing protein [Saprospiraceae bacterium]